jgi:KUP system potassium uptake protein
VADYNPRLKKPLAGLALAALGVVYGDIGTSPLYAAKETFNPNHGIPLNAANVLGGQSAIFRALVIVVALKYLILIMRANNKGEGAQTSSWTLEICAMRANEATQLHSAVWQRVCHILRSG